MAGASKPLTVPTKQQRIAELAEQSPEMGFTSLAYFIDINWLSQAYHRTRKDGALGVDGQTAEDYAVNLEDNLLSLLDRAKSGTYFRPRCDELTFPRPARPPRPDRWEFPLLKTKFFKGRWSWCWSLSTNRTSWTARTASAPDARHTRLWTLCGKRRWRWEVAGFWMWTFESSLTRSTMAISGSF